MLLKSLETRKYGQPSVRGCGANFLLKLNRKRGEENENDREGTGWIFKEDDAPAFYFKRNADVWA